MVTAKNSLQHILVVHFWFTKLPEHLWLEKKNEKNISTSKAINIYLVSTACTTYYVILKISRKIYIFLNHLSLPFFFLTISPSPFMHSYFCQDFDFYYQVTYLSRSRWGNLSWFQICNSWKLLKAGQQWGQLLPSIAVYWTISKSTSNKDQLSGNFHCCFCVCFFLPSCTSYSIRKCPKRITLKQKR